LPWAAAVSRRPQAESSHATLASERKSNERDNTRPRLRRLVAKANARAGR
jgi:hypothetical protein